MHNPDRKESKAKAYGAALTTCHLAQHGLLIAAIFYIEDSHPDFIWVAAPLVLGDLALAVWLPERLAFHYARWRFPDDHR